MSFTIATDHEDLRRKVIQAVQRTPRFLFRFWHSGSGGDPRCNTPSEIRPRAFVVPGEQSPDFFHQSIGSIRDMVSNHLLTYKENDFKTCFSSWSHSLRFVLDFYAEQKDDPEAHICILDTTKLDKGTNLVTHTTPLCEILFGSDERFWHEYLAYGVISGEGYKAVRWSEIKTKGIAFFYEWRITTMADRFQRAEGIAALFGDYFELPILVNMMTVVFRDQEEWRTIAKWLTKKTKLHIPTEWQQDRTIMELDFHVLRLYEALDAAQILRAVIIQRFGLDAHNLRQVREMTPEERRVGYEEVCRQMKESPRMPEAVRERSQGVWKELSLDG